MNCDVAGICGGCPLILDAYSDQLARKRADLLETWRDNDLADALLPEPEMISIAPFGLRDRVDMTLHRVDGRMAMGLYDMDRKYIVDLERCPQMSQAVAPLFATMRSNLPDLPLGSLRLRISPAGEWGIWLDFPNIEIKRFIDDQTWLNWLLERFHVEMGQRRKTLYRDGARLRLGDPQLKPWFETYVGEDMKPQPLYCNVGGFSQVGFAANRVLVGKALDMIRQTGASRWLELGAGIGNFTLPLASVADHVVAVENDRRAVEGLERSMTEAGLEDKIRVAVVNMHRADPMAMRLLENCDAILADPPRSGLRGFVDVMLESEHKPRWFLYVSCFAMSFCADIARLHQDGWRIRSISGVDQFPQSRHCEWVALLERIPS